MKKTHPLFTWLSKTKSFRLNNISLSVMC
uniref:Uncharacterized protein n=1 Tax=Anguilla anguilla TaxID=7936 RepID=A0A0E9WC94_ANGAN